MRIPSLNAINVYHFVKLFFFMVDDILIFSMDRIFLLRKFQNWKYFWYGSNFKTKIENTLYTGHHPGFKISIEQSKMLRSVSYSQCFKFPVFRCYFFFLEETKRTLFERSLCDHTAIAHNVKRRKKNYFEKSYRQETERCEIKENRMIYMRTPPHI